MTDKEKIKAEVSTLIGEALLEHAQYATSPNIFYDLKKEYSEKIVALVDSMQEEPVTKFKVGDKICFKECKANTAVISKVGNTGYFCENGMFIHFGNQNFWELVEEPVSEDLEKASKEWLTPQLDKSYAVYGEAKMMELTKFDGYAMLDAIEFGAKWQFERVNEALLSEVLPCFMHGGEADEVVAKLEEVLNQKKYED